MAKHQNFLTSDALHIEVDRDILETGAEVTISITKSGEGCFQVLQEVHLDYDQMGRFLDRKCVRYQCGRCPISELCADWNEAV